MQKGNSFTEYVKNTFDNQFWDAAGEYIENDWEPQWEHKRLHKIGANEIEDVKVVHVWAIDGPGMEIKFDVLIRIELTIYEGDYHYDNSDSEVPMIIAHCEGDLDKNLEDFRITSVEPYSGCYRKKEQNELDDSLVLVMGKDDLDRYAESFLQQYYPEALLKPCKIDPIKLASNLGLTIIESKITADGSIFGRCFFQDCDTEIYDEETKTFVKKEVKAGTIIVDPDVAFMRNIGSFNNTVVHECVHWAFHRKAFALARLYDGNLSNVSCEISGGVPGHSMGAVDWMEWQANALAPRIQMPASMFKLRADRLVSQYRRIKEGYDVIDLIEPMIKTLAGEFGVSCQAAKIRLIDVGYDEAQSAFQYVDGHYVKPHKTWIRGLLKPEQTFTIGIQDASLQLFSNIDLRNEAEKGLFQFVDNHVVLNSPVFIGKDESGKACLTHYALTHMEECCLVFEMAVSGEYRARYKKECFLNRDHESPCSFSIGFDRKYSNSNFEKQKKITKERMQDEMEFCDILENSNEKLLERGKTWCEEMYYKDAVVRSNKITESELIKERRTKTYRQIAKERHIDTDDDLTVNNNEIAIRTGLNPETVGRCISGKTTNRDTLILICLALHLPPDASNKVLKNAGITLRSNDLDEYCYNKALTVLYGNTVEEINREIVLMGGKPLMKER